MSRLFPGRVGRDHGFPLATILTYLLCFIHSLIWSKNAEIFFFQRFYSHSPHAPVSALFNQLLLINQCDTDAVECQVSYSCVVQ